MGKVTKELQDAIQVVADLAIFYDKQGKHNMARYAVNARLQLEAARHVEKIIKDD
jgi:hypothetical protein